MKIILQQNFPLGRFHATPWKVFPYDDPHGEWPPSPWRFLRALLARSHQLEREGDPVDDSARKKLVRAFVSSQLSWLLPASVWRGPGLRQYQPAEFKKIPAAAKEPGMLTYNTTKVQDNFWLTAGEAQPLFWIFSGEVWDESTRSLLDHCLERMTYFGRAESITVFQQIDEQSLPEPPNCILSSSRTSDSVPILCPLPEATLDQLQLTTDEKAVRNSTVPPGAVWKFAQRPTRPPIRVMRKPSKPKHQPTCFLQFALGSHVTPSLDHIAMISNWFRGRAVRYFLERECGMDKGDWQQASEADRKAVSLLSGKGADKKKLSGHEHTYFGLYLDPITKKPTRLIAWRKTKFTQAEEKAIRLATSDPFSLGYRKNPVKGEETRKGDPWKVHCVPLDNAVPPPPGFDHEQPFVEWESLTPYVPPRHAFDSRGKPKNGEAPVEQLQRELERSGFPVPKFISLDCRNQLLSDEHTAKGEWVKVHEPKKVQSGPTNRSKRAYRFRLTFPKPVSGPIALGHSSHFGLGLFVPIRNSE